MLRKHINCMEELVENSVDSVIKSTKCCNCDRCKYDIIALALNQLPPVYVVSEKEKFQMKLKTLEQQFEINIVAAITKAIDVVKKYPRHDIN